VRRLDSATLLATWERGLAEDPVGRGVLLLSALTGSPPDEVATWDLGRRDTVLAGLLRAAIGPVAWTCTVCDRCGERLDVPLDLSPVADAPLRPVGEVLTTSVDGAAVRFRLPTSDDLRGLPASLGPAAAALLARCIVDAPGDGAGGPEADRIDPDPGRDPDSDRDDCGGADDGGGAGAVGRRAGAAVIAAVEAALEAACPTGAVRVTVACPACGAPTSAALDLPVLVWAEVETRASTLLGEVHALARAYGWTEPDVLALSPERRAAYLELVGA
jgi:hypothetical protein